MNLDVQKPEIPVDSGGLEPKFVDTRQKYRKIMDGKPIELEAILVEGLFVYFYKI